MKSTSLSALLLSKTLNIDPVLFDPVVREYQRKGSLGNVLRGAAIDKITPDSIKKIQEGIKKWQGRKVALGRKIIEARELGEEREWYRALGRPAKTGRRSTAARSLPQDRALRQAYSQAKSSGQNTNWSTAASTGFSPNYSGMASTPESFAAFLQREQASSGSSRGTASSSFAGGSQSPYTRSTPKFGNGNIAELIEVQTATYSLMKLNFKESAELLKQIITAIKNLDGSGGGNVSSLTKTAAAGGAFAAALATAKKYGKKLVKGAPLITAGYENYSDTSLINKAEQAGIYSKEEAKILRRKSLIKRGSAAVGGFATGALGTVTAGLPGTVAGGIVGYNFGEEIGQTIGDSLYGKPKDMTSSGYLAAVAYHESRLNPNARAVDSLTAAQKAEYSKANRKLPTAAGLYQFTDDTWSRLNKKYGKNYSLADKMDPKKSTEMARLLSAENQAALQRSLGRSVTDTELYTAHFMGSSNATKLLKADSEMMADQLLPSAAFYNKGAFYNKDGTSKTVGALRAQIAANYANSAAKVGAVPDMTLPMIPDIAAAQIITSSEGTQQPITSSDVKAFAQQKIAQQSSQAASTAAMTAAISKLSKDSAVAKNAKISSTNSPTYIPVNGGGGGYNQSAFSDINSIHIMDGLLLNILTD